MITHYKAIELTEHYMLELGLFTYGAKRFELTFNMSISRGDHRGFYFNIYLIGIGAEFNIYSDEHESDREVRT